MEESVATIFLNILPFGAIFCLSSLPWSGSLEIPASSLQPAELQPRANDPYGRKIRDGSAPSKQGTTGPSNLQWQRPKKDCEFATLGIYACCELLWESRKGMKRHENATFCLCLENFTEFRIHETTSKVPDRCPRAPTSHFLHQIISQSLSWDTFPKFWGSHPTLDILAWRYKAMAFKIVSKPGLSEIFCIARGIICVSWMASCVPLCSHVLKTFSNVKTLLRLHYLLQGSCQWFSSGSWHMRASSWINERASKTNVLARSREHTWTC